MYCNKCGYELKDADRFCPKCGTEVSYESKTTARIDPEKQGTVEDKYVWPLAFTSLLSYLLAWFSVKIGITSPWIVTIVIVLINCVFLYLDVNYLRNNEREPSNWIWLGIVLVPVYLGVRAYKTNRNYIPMIISVVLICISFVVPNALDKVNAEIKADKQLIQTLSKDVWEPLGVQVDNLNYDTENNIITMNVLDNEGTTGTYTLYYSETWNGNNITVQTIKIDFEQTDNISSKEVETERESETATETESIAEVVTEIENKETVSEVESAIPHAYSDDELCELAIRYYYDRNGFKPCAVVSSIDGDMVTIHLFEDMDDHVVTCDWYTVDRTTGIGTDFLENEINMANIGQCEDGDLGIDNETRDFILSESSTRYINEADMSLINENNVRYAINEIYARHGRKFKDQELQKYFENKSWYIPIYEPETFDAMGESIFNEFEIKNIERLQKYRDSGY